MASIRLISFAVAATVATTPVFATGSAPFVRATDPAGDSIEWDVEKGRLPAFVFLGTDISAEDAEFFCSKRRGAVWARIGDTIYAVNEAASDPKIEIGEDGVSARALPAGDRTNIATASTEVATRIVAQAERVCDPQPIVVRSQAMTELDYAYSICEAADRTGETTQPCEVSAGGRRIDVTMNVNRTGAESACLEIKAFTALKGWSLRGWRVFVSSPYSGGKSLAFCEL